MRFVRLERRPDDWDETIRGFDTKTLFHESAWLDHASSIHSGGTVEYFRLEDGDAALGYYCALRVRKMMLPISGSPLGGTGTNFMGPIVNDDVDQREVVRALKRLIRKQHYLHLELSHYWLDRELMASEGFNVHESVTHLCRLPDNLEDGWGTLKSTCRNRVRKAEKRGLVVERTDDPSIVQHYQDQFEEVYGKQGMAVPYDIQRPRSLFENLNPAGKILPLWVRYEDEIIATGLFPHDERCIYFWGGTSWLKHHKLCPNEILHWTVIKSAIEMGIPAYNMCGGHNQFKNKFGGDDVPYIHYSKSALPFMKTARRLYRKAHWWRLKHSFSRN